MQATRIDRIATRRITAREPLAYLLREAWLGPYRFYVDRRVIVPRSFIGHLLLDGMTPWVSKPGRVRRVLDLCTGSGCLAILAALAFGRARVDATDVAKQALTVARRNVAAYRLGRRLRLIESDVFDALGERRYDLILANPPYVTAGSMRRLPAEYRHEPTLALAGGNDGLDVVRRILSGARRHLSPRGLLVVEIGHNRRALERAFPRVPFWWAATRGSSDAVFVLRRDELPLDAA